jgi:ABC-type nitrate/sulfonate/bicarbonate transport system substrate-binding protein
MQCSEKHLVKAVSHQQFCNNSFATTVSTAFAITVHKNNLANTVSESNFATKKGAAIMTIVQNDNQHGAIASLWYTRCAVPTASSVAFQQGWLQESFAAIDISLDSVRASEDDSIRASHYDNSLPNQFREGGNVPAIWAKAAGQPTVVVGITWVDEFQAIVARADSPLTSAADLRGRRLGLPKQQNSELVDHGRASALHGFVTTLGVAGISTDDVQFVDVEAPRTDIREDPASGVLSDGNENRRSVLDALRDGEVDAAYIKGPGAIKNIRTQGLKVLFDIGGHPDPLVHVNNAVPRPITADRELLARRPDLIVRYLTVLLRTGHWATQHPQEALQLVAHETSSDVADAAAAYGPELHNHLLPTLRADIVAGLERQKDFLFKWGFLPNDFNFADWIDYAPLREAQRLLAAGEGGAALVKAAS